MASPWRLTSSGCRRDMVTEPAEKMQCSWWSRACVVQYDRRAPYRILMIQISANENEAKIFRSHPEPLELCDILVNALQHLANHGDSPKESIAAGLDERSRNSIMDGVRNVIEVDCGWLVPIKSNQVKKPQFSEAFPEAVIRECAVEGRHVLTLCVDRSAGYPLSMCASLSPSFTEGDEWEDLCR